jgi:hypothetical protein
MWGYVDGGELVSMCHAAANLVPVEATDEALDAFITRSLVQGRHCSSIVGEAAAVERIWAGVENSWGPARLVRPRQPFLTIDAPARTPSDPKVRRVHESEFETLYPACVAMFTEEVGVSPEIGGGRDAYRARVRQLIAKGLAFAHIERDKVRFKAEVGSVTPYACQVQGVWVHPDHRGEGLSGPGMAAVVDQALATVAPVVTLYVNEYNIAARRTYERVGFRERCHFATVLF